MKKLNKDIYNKLYLQAQEASDQDLKKLARAILFSIGSVYTDKSEKYNIEELDENVFNNLFKLSLEVVKYYDIKEVDTQQLEELIEELSEDFIEKIKDKLKVDEVISDNDEPLLGEK